MDTLIVRFALILLEYTAAERYIYIDTMSDKLGCIG